MKLTFAAVLSLLSIAGVAAAQPKGGGDEAAIRALEQKWDTANLKRDVGALSTILADSFISTNPEGKVSTKAEVMGRLQSGEIKYQAAKVDDMKIVVYGDTAVANGRWKGKFVEKGKTVEATERFTDTFLKRNGQWRCVASHASAIK